MSEARPGPIEELRGRPWLAGGLAALPLALWAVGPTLGRWKTPGAGDALFETLLGAEAPWSSASPAASLLIAAFGQVVDPAMALGLVVFVGYWLAGFGGWMLGLRVGADGEDEFAEAPTPWASAAVGLAALQLSPALLRGVCSGEVGVLGLGLAGLAVGLRGRGGLVAAALATLWCAPAGLMALAGGWRQRARWAVVLPLLALQLLSTPSPEPGRLRAAPASSVEVMAYVTEAGAALPQPALEAQAAPAPSPRQWLRGLHGGVAAVIGGLLALALGPRALGAAGLLLGAFVLAGAGPMPPPEAAGAPLPPWLAQAALPSFGPGGLAWGAAAALAGAAGLARLSARASWGIYPAVVLIFFSALVENPRLALPVSNLPPDPGLNTLAEVDPGAVIIFPSPEAPWRQAGRSLGEHRWMLRDVDKPIAAPELVAGLVGQLCATSGVAVDLSAGPLIWATRETAPAALVEQGVAYLLVDRRSLSADGKGPLEGWLAATIGTPLAEGEGYALYTLDKEKAEEIRELE